MIQQFDGPRVMHAHCVIIAISFTVLQPEMHFSIIDRAI